MLLGPSGAGKSTLINALAGVEVQETGAVRAGDGKGKHTTTSRELVPLPGGAVLMDTPGVRGFGLFDADGGMAEMFGDLEELFEQCRFSDCAHGREPGCAVQAALADGSLEDRRWASYLKLQRELAALARRHDAAARRAYAPGVAPEDFRWRARANARPNGTATRQPPTMVRRAAGRAGAGLKGAAGGPADPGPEYLQSNAGR